MIAAGKDKRVEIAVHNRAQRASKLTDRERVNG
jgi:hypothetical protein